MHGSLEFIVDSCNSRLALSSNADIQSSVPLVIDRRERLVVSVDNKQINIDELVHTKQHNEIGMY